ncbi:MAG: NUDIX hydrolase [Candidatus Paceibacterota bacterium]|jgi:8-oxo-dGTP pyrophosphatase MutT (NUDIX family)
MNQTQKIERHFNVTVYVLNQETKRFLLIKHKKIGKWLAPGGHVDPNETPDCAALREVKEETGLTINLIGERLPRKTDLIRPFGIQLNIIKPEEHEHMDLIYLGIPEPGQTEKINKEETDGIGWFSLEDIKNPSFDTFDDTRQWCEYFLK